MSGNDGNKSCCGSFCGFIVTSGFVVLIYWAIFQPHQIRATVDSAALSNLTVVATSSTVSYHLAVNLSLYNPSKRVSIYYDTLDAELRLLRDSVVIDQLQVPALTASPTEFYQRRKTGDGVRLEFDVVAGQLLDANRGDAGTAVVRMEMHVDVRVRYAFGAVKIRQKPRVRCPITIVVPVVKAEGGPAGPGVGGAVSPGDRCTVKYR